MALSRHGSRRAEPPIWSGFVDALTTLLLVLMFVLTIFMVVQSVLRETIDTQGSKLTELSAQVAGLADALGLEQTRAEDLQTEVDRLGGALSAAETEGAAKSAEITTLTGQLVAREGDLTAARARITNFETQVASLLAERDTARVEGVRLASDLAATQTAAEALKSEQEALNLALAKARSEVDASAEAARLAAARREALEALIASLKTDVTKGEGALTKAMAALAAADATSKGLSQEKARLQGEIAVLEARKAALDTDAANLRVQLSEAEKAGLAQKAAAEAARAVLAAQIAALQAGQSTALTDAASLRARLTEVEASLTSTEKARLAEAAAAEALRLRLADSRGALSQAEKTRLADLAAAEALRAKLASADDALTAMTLKLEEERKHAEETLTMLAAAEAAGKTAQSDAQIKAGLLEASRKVLTDKGEAILSERRKVALLNQQVAALRTELGSLQAMLDASSARDRSANVQLETLGGRLNAALAQVASEERQRAQLEAAEKRRLEAENQNLEKFRSEFFGQLRQVLAGREGVRVEGDRFVFSSEVLFNPGSADLAPEGKTQIAGVVATLNEISREIPKGIDWIIRVDGHTDDVPLSGNGAFADNWELSQARALSVVRFMQNVLGFPPQRLAATGFGEWRPVALGDSAYARSLNRRIELKLTER